MNIDKNIYLYSLAELETMQRIWSNKNANHSSVPFTSQEISDEINKRISQPNKTNQDA